MIIIVVIVLIELVTSNNIYCIYSYFNVTFDSDTAAPAVTQMHLQVAADDKRI